MRYRRLHRSVFACAGIHDLAWGGDADGHQKEYWTYLRTVDTIAASPHKASIEPRSCEALQSLGAFRAAKS